MNRAVILAAGSAARFGKPKLLQKLWGKPVLFWSLRAFEQHPEIDEIVLVISDEYAAELRALAASFPKVHQVVNGGATRFESSWNGVLACDPKKDDMLIMHNAANPGVTAAEISAVLKAAQAHGAAGVARQFFSTLRQQKDGALELLPREELFAMETPQALQAQLFLRGAELWPSQASVPTDDLALAERCGITPLLLSASGRNVKLTTPEDLHFLEQLKTPQRRIGYGEDAHRFTEEKKPGIIGGMEITNAPGFAANSDGDIALHALCNALLSAIGQSSFSRIADPLCAQGLTDSRRYLKAVLEELAEVGAEIENIALAFEGKTPKLEFHFPAMRRSLSQLLLIPEQAIGLTAQSGEGLSSYGRGEGMRCAATVLLKLFPGDEEI